jgi:hypothetical protein
MNRFAKMFLFAAVAFAAFGIVSMETADAGCYGYGGWHATPYFSPAYYAPAPIYSYTPAYGYGSPYGCGYGYGYGGW